MFVGWIEEIARADQSRARHQGQFVILEKKYLNAVRKSELHRLRNFERRQGRKFQIFVRRQIHGPAVDLRLSHRKGRSQKRQKNKKRFHLASFAGAAASAAGGTIQATVRVSGIRYSFATRWTSSAVTLAISSISVNILRQSPYAT